MHKLNPHKVGLTLGAFIGVLFIVWSVVLASGMGSQLVAWKLGVYFLSIPIAVLPFSLGGAIMLIILGGIGGYVLGWLWSTLWNKIAV